MLNSAQGPDPNPNLLLKKAVFLCIAAIYITSTIIVHILIDICAHSAVIEPLRAKM